jgi:hypothetical protein
VRLAHRWVTLRPEPTSIPFRQRGGSGSFADGPCRTSPDRVANLLSDDPSRADGRGRHTVELEGCGYRWLRVGGLDYILRRSR